MINSDEITDSLHFGVGFEVQKVGTSCQKMKISEGQWTSFTPSVTVVINAAYITFVPGQAL
jgi:hypothetical protein